MSGPALPENIDTTYADDLEDDSVAVHQQHHDAIHDIVNKFDKDAVPSSGDFLSWDGSLYQPTAHTAHSLLVPKSVADAKGDILVGTANDTVSVLGVGANDTILMADSAQTSGHKWVGSQTPSTQAFGDSAAQGTADTYSRGDHKHAMPAEPDVSGAITTHAAAADPHTGYQKESEKAAASGYASLDGSTKIPIAQVPTGTTSTTVSLGNHTHATVKGAVVFSLAGTVATGTGAMRWYNDSGQTLTITSARATVGTAPTGASLIVDVNVNGTSIWTGVQNNRPTITAAANTATGGALATTSIADGSYMTCDIDQVGSTVAGADLNVTVWISGISS